MDLEKAKKAHAIINKIEDINRQIKKLRENDCILCFGALPSSISSDDVYVSQRENYPLRNMLDEHHRMIVAELVQSVAKLEKELSLL